jgi:hypothetical protein
MPNYELLVTSYKKKLCQKIKSDNGELIIERELPV